MSLFSAEGMWVLLGIALTVYALSGGADFGSGVWDLLAPRRHKDKTRTYIEHAIGPIWEANHVWLIFLIVLSFTAFPRAYAVVSVAFHIPLLVALFGIVLRGAAFVFRSYGLSRSRVQARWSLVFAAGSVLGPFALGTTLGGMSSGDVRVEGSRVVSGLTAGWTTAFALGTGVFALVLFALLAAVYLAHRARRADEVELAEAFRRRALMTEGVAGAVAAFVLWRAKIDAPVLFDRLWSEVWALPLQGATAVCALVVVIALYKRQYAIARGAVIAQVALVILGWGAAMGGAIVLPDVTLANAGTRPETLAALAWPLGLGTLALIPALVFLFSVFERHSKERVSS